jgi:ferrous iron transport protein A
MKFNSTNAASDLSLDTPLWSVTFVGGTADLAEVSHGQREDKSTPVDVRIPLAMTTVGDRVWVVQIKGGHRMVRRLTDLGITQGSEVTVVSRTESGSVIVGLQSCRIGLGAGMAHRVLVTTDQPNLTRDITAQQPEHSVNGDPAMPATLHLGALTVGQSGYVVGYEKAHRAYREKLLSMGLTPGTHFTVTRQAPMGDPIEIEVRGYKLSLRKGEAAALKVETVPAPDAPTPQ